MKKINIMFSKKWCLHPFAMVYSDGVFYTPCGKCRSCLRRRRKEVSSVEFLRKFNVSHDISPDDLPF